MLFGSMPRLEGSPPELRVKAMQVFEEKQRKEQERTARFGQIKTADFNGVARATNGHGPQQNLLLR